MPEVAVRLTLALGRIGSGCVGRPLCRGSQIRASHTADERPFAMVAKSDRPSSLRPRRRS
jgi:hypothetical protein